MATPGPPRIFQPRADPNMLDFEWLPPTNPNGEILGYRLQLNDSLTYILDAGLRYYSVTGLSNGVWYNATIEASNANGYGEKAYYRPFQPGSIPPEPPSSISVEYSLGNTSALVSWTPPTTQPDAPVYWYPIYATSADSNYPVRKYTGDATSQKNYYIFNDLNPNSNVGYTFSVYAANCPGWSIPRSVSINPRPKIPLKANWATRINFSNVNNVGSTNSSATTDSDENLYLFTYGATSSNANTQDLQFYNYTSISGSNYDLNLAANLNYSNLRIYAFITKYDKNGSLSWVVPITTSSSSSGFSISSSINIDTDNSGNVYVSFSTSSVNNITLTFYNYVNASGTNINLTPYGNYANANSSDIIIIKYAPNGTVLWVAGIGGPGVQYELAAYNSYSLKVDKSTGDSFINLYTNVDTTTILDRDPTYTAGSGTITFNQLATIPRRSGTNSSALLVKFNTNGSFQLVNRIAGAAMTSGLCTLDNNGNIIFTVYYANSNSTPNTSIDLYNGISSGVVQFTPSYNLPVVGYSSSKPAIISISSSNTVNWTSYIGSSNLINSMQISALSDNSIVLQLQHSAAGTPAILFSFSSFSGLNPILTSNTTTFNGVSILKINSNGVFNALTRIHTNSSGLTVTSYSIRNTSSDNIYVGGTWSTSPLTIESASSNFTTTVFATLPIINSTGDAFIIKYDSNLVANASTRLDTDASGSTDGIYSMGITSNYLYLSGTFSGRDRNLNVYSYSNIDPSTSNINLSLAGVLSNAYTGAINTQIFLAQYTV